MTIASPFKSSWFPQEASSASSNTGAFGRFRALRPLPRGALGSSRALPLRPPPPASPSPPPISSSPPPAPRPRLWPRLATPWLLPLAPSPALAGSQARLSRQARAAGGAPGAGRGARSRRAGALGRRPALREALGPALLRGPAGRGPGPARGGESRLAPPLRCPPQSCCLPRGRPVL